MPPDLRIFVCLLLSPIYTVWTVSGIDETICPEGCECTGLSAHCRGDNNSWVAAVNNLPTNTENFTFTISAGSLYRKVHIDLSANLGRLQNLVEFQINMPAEYFEVDYSLIYRNEDEQIGPTVFCGLQRLKALHLNARLGAMLNASAIACLKNLGVLDLSYTMKMSKFETIPLFAAPLSREITTLLLRHMQTFDHSEVRELNFATLFTGLNRFKLEVLDLADNSFTSLSPGVLLMTRLKKLDLSGNLLFTGRAETRFTWFEILLHPTVQEVVATHQELVNKYTTTATQEDTPHLKSEMVKQKANSVGTLNFDPVKHFGPVIKLQNFLAFKPSTAQKANVSSAGQCMYNTDVPMGRHIRLLNLTSFLREGFPYRNKLPKGCLCFNPNNKLQWIDVSNNRLDQFLDDPNLEHFRTSGFNRLTTLNIRNNNLKVKLQSQFFSGLPSLHTLLLGGNRVQLLSNDSVLLPKTLGKLRMLDLSLNHIETLPYLEFHFLRNMEVLDLSRNQLQEFNIKLPKSSTFKKLDISGNKLTSIHADMTMQLDEYEHLEVNLQDNLLVCGCGTSHFVHWVQSTAVKLTGRDTLYCFTDVGRVPILKLNFQKLYSDCHPLTTVQIALISVSSTVCFFCLILSSSYIYRQRWRMRYFLYRRRLRRQREERELNDDYDYDAFVSFCDANEYVRDWVQTKLEMELCDKRKFRLFSSQLNVFPEECLLQEIDEGMGKCRKIIMILSPDYLRDWRCVYEAWGAHTMVPKDRDAVVLVKLQALPIIAGLPSTLASQMEMRECFTWTEDPVGQELFWERLVDAL